MYKVQDEKIIPFIAFNSQYFRKLRFKREFLFTVILYLVCKLLLTISKYLQNVFSKLKVIKRHQRNTLIDEYLKV